jgi:hypothetical protein
MHVGGLRGLALAAPQLLRVSPPSLTPSGFVSAEAEREPLFRARSDTKRRDGCVAAQSKSGRQATLRSGPHPFSLCNTCTFCSQWKRNTVPTVGGGQNDAHVACAVHAAMRPCGRCGSVQVAFITSSGKCAANNIMFFFLCGFFRDHLRLYLYIILSFIGCITEQSRDGAGMGPGRGSSREWVKEGCWEPTVV